MKDNARLLFVVTITCTVSFTTMAAFFSIYKSVDEEYENNYPIPFNYFSNFTDVQRDNNLALITSTLDEERLLYNTVSVPLLEFENGSRQNIAALSAEGYNRLAKLLNRETVQLNSGEVIKVSIWTNKKNTHLTMKQDETVSLGSDTLRLVGVIQDNIFPESSFSSLYVLNDADFEQHDEVNKGIYYGYSVPNWKDAAIAAEKIDAQMTRDFTAFMYLSSPDWYKTDQLTYKLFLFVGSFISIVFLIAAGSFIYFRFYTDVQTEKAKYHSLRKIGMTNREAKKITTIQLAILFFIPFLIAILHTAFALQILQTLISSSIGSSALIVLVAFLIALSLYFLLLRSRYLKSLLEEV